MLNVEPFFMINNEISPNGVKYLRNNSVELMSTVHISLLKFRKLSKALIFPLHFSSTSVLGLNRKINSISLYSEANKFLITKKICNKFSEIK